MRGANRSNRKGGAGGMTAGQMQRHHELRKTYRKVGFYGCAEGVVRVELRKPPESGTYPRRIRLKCPGCGHEHDVSLAWRPYRAGIDEGKPSVLVSGL